VIIAGPDKQTHAISPSFTLFVNLKQSLHSHEASVNRGSGPSISHVPVEEGGDPGVSVEAVLKFGEVVLPRTGRTRAVLSWMLSLIA
jgi:hypothetical protein